MNRRLCILEKASDIMSVNLTKEVFTGLMSDLVDRMREVLPALFVKSIEFKEPW